RTNSIPKFSNVIAAFRYHYFPFSFFCKFFNVLRSRRSEHLANAFSFLSYDTVRNFEIWASLPVASLLKTNGIVALWITNSPSIKSFATEQLIRKWQLKLLASWTWLKVNSVTRSGRPVCEFGGDESKKPFETLLIAVKKVGSPSLRELPKERLIISVPSAVPSRKPPLREILQPWLPKDFNCLELFARSLQPSTTSIGYEVLKMQNKAWFVPSTIH
ncbi:unnamed protein product, partial [Soboliphyme baturini]|uniref:MT-A70 family protein n=1 Tax=Soboliphyme baturini TaxID=241478 RepID=A0A183ITB6_9BILA